MQRQYDYLFNIGCATVLCILMAVTAGAQDSEDAIEQLKQAALAEAASVDVSEQEETAFTSGALGLQTLNPEISVTGDFLWSYQDEKGNDTNSDFLFRVLGLHFESYLDPFTKFKAAVGINQNGAEFGEGYLTRFGVFPQVNLTLGKFRQQFGVVNRWHKHGLDQVDFPMPLRMIFGEGGLNQTGASVDWTMPDFANCSQEATLQVTDGENGRVFGQNDDNMPSVLAHYKVFRDIADSTYVELGATCLYGQNDEWEVLNTTEEKNLDTWVCGIDFTLLWEPTDRMRYRNLTWRSEAYFLNKNILAPDGSGKDTINAWGMYSYLESKISRTLCLGVRGDYFVPEVMSTDVFSPLAVTEDDAYRWQFGPYVTWHQSPFVHFRAEFNHVDGEGTGAEENVLWLQCIFAAGPHKHERY